MSPKDDRHLAKQARMVAIVIAITTLVWLGAQLLGKQIGLAGRYAILFDLAALAAFFWALIVSIQIWRKRRED